jgi:hypothetical protein
MDPYVEWSTNTPLIPSANTGVTAELLLAQFEPVPLCSCQLPAAAPALELQPQREITVVGVPATILVSATAPCETWKVRLQIMG